MCGAADHLCCHWELKSVDITRARETPGVSVLNHIQGEPVCSHEQCRLPGHCHIGSTCFTELLHICLHILDQPRKEGQMLRRAFRYNETNAAESYL